MRPPPVRWLVLGALALAFAIARITPAWPALVAADGTITFPETDPYYHLRQAQATFEEYPHLPRWDASSHYPAVNRDNAAGLFTLLLATVAHAVELLPGVAPGRALAWVCLLIAPALGLFLPLLVYRLVRPPAGERVALLMAGWSLLIPGEGLVRTTLGFCDHHVAEMLLGLLIVIGLLAADERHAERPRPLWQPAWLGAAPLVTLVFTWVGAPLVVAVVAVAQVGQIVADAAAGRSPVGTLRGAARYWLAFSAGIGLPGLVWPDLVLHVPLWQAAVVGGATGCVTLAGLAAWLERLPTGRPQNRRLAVALVAGAVVLALAVASVAPLREAVTQMVTRKVGLVQENAPVTATYFLQLTSVAGLIAVLVPALGVWSGAWARPRWWLAVLPSLLFIALWARTFDYGYHAALHAVVLAGYGFACLPRGRARWGAAAAATVAAVVAIWPLRWATPPWISRAWFTHDVVLAHRGWQEGLRWLRAHAGDAAASAETGAPGPRAVLTDWTAGNLVTALAGLPAINSRYPEAEGVRPLYLSDEDELLAAPVNGSTVAAAVRYIAVTPREVAQALPANLRTIGRELPPADRGAENRWLVQQLALPGDEGFARLRRVFESEAEVWYRRRLDPRTREFAPMATPLESAADRALARQALAQGTWQEDRFEASRGRIAPALSIHEIVPGAELVGRAGPGQEVTVFLPLVAEPHGRRFVYLRRTRADAAGGFRVRVPYATESTPGDRVRPRGPMTLSAGSERIEVHVPESAIRAGATLAVAPLASG